MLLWEPILEIMLISILSFDRGSENEGLNTTELDFQFSVFWQYLSRTYMSNSDLHEEETNRCYNYKVL